MLDIEEIKELTSCIDSLEITNVKNYFYNLLDLYFKTEYKLNYTLSWENGYTLCINTNNLLNTKLKFNTTFSYVDVYVSEFYLISDIILKCMEYSSIPFNNLYFIHNASINNSFIEYNGSGHVPYYIQNSPICNHYNYLELIEYCNKHKITHNICNNFFKAFYNIDKTYTRVEANMRPSITVLFRNMFETDKDFIKIANVYINAGIPIKDEFNNIYKKEIKKLKEDTNTLNNSIKNQYGINIKDINIFHLNDMFLEKHKNDIIEGDTAFSTADISNNIYSLDALFANIIYPNINNTIILNYLESDTDNADFIKYYIIILVLRLTSILLIKNYSNIRVYNYYEIHNFLDFSYKYVRTNKPNNITDILILEKELTLFDLCLLFNYIKIIVLFLKYDPNTVNMLKECTDFSIINYIAIYHNLEKLMDKLSIRDIIKWEHEDFYTKTYTYSNELVSLLDN